MVDYVEIENAEFDEGWLATSKAEVRMESHTRRAVDRVRRGLWIAAIILLFLNSAGLAALVQGLPVGGPSDAVIALAETWHKQMGLNQVTDILHTIREGVNDLRELSWGEVEAAADEMEQEGFLLRGGFSEG